MLRSPYCIFKMLLDLFTDVQDTAAYSICLHHVC
jgi:hypothetical protein